MAKFNHMEVNGAALQKLLEAKQALGGLETIPPRFNIVGCKAQAPLRAFYAATGGKRTGPSGYNPSNDELRDLYNGRYTNGGTNDAGATLYAIRMGHDPAEKASRMGHAPAEKPVKAEPAIVAKSETENDRKARLLAELLGGQSADPEQVRQIALSAVSEKIGDVLSSMSAIVAEELAKQTKTVEVKIANLPPIKAGVQHQDFSKILMFVANGENIIVVGPAGCGKTRMAEEIAKCLSRKYYFTGKTYDETKVLGYMNGHGQYVRTAFRDAWEHGGLFLFDEIDGWSPEALIAVNAMLAGNWGDFPDGQIPRHPDFVAMGAANTFGRGADRRYVGRNQLDGSSLSRFGIVEIGYDEALELAICPNDKWTRHVQKLRAAAEKAKVDHIICTRAAMGGGKMVMAGLDWAEAEEAYVWKGLEENQRNRILAEVR